MLLIALNGRFYNSVLGNDISDSGDLRGRVSAEGSDGQGRGGRKGGKR